MLLVATFCFVCDCVSEETRPLYFLPCHLYFCVAMGGLFD